MIYLHLLMAMLSVWRITELFTQDRITDRLRKKFPTYLWQCTRCMSIWAAFFATAAFVFFPWANWPFALAWLYLWHNDEIYVKRLATKGRRLLVEVAQDGSAKWQNEFSPQDTHKIIGIVLGGNSPGVPNGEARGLTKEQ